MGLGRSHQIHCIYTYSFFSVALLLRRLRGFWIFKAFSPNLSRIARDFCEYRLLFISISMGGYLNETMKLIAKKQFHWRHWDASRLKSPKSDAIHDCDWKSALVRRYDGLTSPPAHKYIDIPRDRNLVITFNLPSSIFDIALC